MYKFALIGYPLSQSLSAVIHQAALKSFSLDGSYELLETTQEDLINRLKFLKTHDYCGFNITIPLKVPMRLFLDGIDEAGNIAGAVNTVKIMEDKTLYGYNTDVFGFKEAIPVDIQKQLNGNKVAILGNGGAARGVTTALSMLKVSEIDFYVRNVIDASKMVDILRSNFPSIKMDVKPMNYIQSLKEYSMLINTTPIGMRGKAMGISPIDRKIIETLPNSSIVDDIVYNPYKTELIKIAEDSGHRTIKGLDMLIFQGAKAFEIWTGKKPNTDKMKIAALETLVI